MTGARPEEQFSPYTNTTPTGTFRAGGQASANMLTSFQPHSGQPRTPLDACADEFLKTQKFEMICAQALQLASILPQDPPPEQFTSFEATAMHQWYEAFLVEFTHCFARRLRSRHCYPMRAVLSADGSIISEEDPQAFNNETIAHVTSILRSFNSNFKVNTVSLGRIDNLSIDLKQPHTALAILALRDVTIPAEFPPKAGWKAGEPLHSEYRRRLGMFRIGVVRLIQESKEDAWMLEVPLQLERGVRAYEEFYIAHLRQNILAAKGIRWGTATIFHIKL